MAPFYRDSQIGRQGAKTCLSYEERFRAIEPGKVGEEAEPRIREAVITAMRVAID